MNLKTLLLFTSISLLCIGLSCTVDLKKFNRNTTKKCHDCEEFLKTYQFFEEHNREYDNSTFRGFSEYIENPDTITLPRSKAYFMNGVYQSKLYDHKFCFIGMKKHELERRFSSKMKKFTGPEPSIDYQRWFTSYTYSIGLLEKDSTITVDFSISTIFYYDIINGDTIYSPERSEIAMLKECLDKEGVRYKE